MKSTVLFLVFSAVLLTSTFVAAYPTFAEYVVEYNKIYSKTEYAIR